MWKPDQSWSFCSLAGAYLTGGGVRFDQDCSSAAAAANALRASAEIEIRTALRTIYLSYRRSIEANRDIARAG
jgi:hypothetical protein